MPRYPSGMAVHAIPGAYHSGRAGRTELNWTNAKLLLGAGAGADPTEIDVPAGGAGGDSFIVVAAANTPATLKDRADHVCAGTNLTGGDQVDINAALAAADIVILCPGTFWIDGSIVMASWKSLIGGGDASIIKYMDASPSWATLSMIINTDHAGAGNRNITIRNLTIDGNRVNQLGGGQGLSRGAYLRRVNSVEVSGCFVTGLTNEGIYIIDSPLGPQVDAPNIIARNRIWDMNNPGIFVGKSHDLLIFGNSIFKSVGDGINLYTCHEAVVANNSLYDLTGNGISILLSFGAGIGCEFIKVIGNVVGNVSRNCLYIKESDHGSFIGNSLFGARKTALANMDCIKLEDSDYNNIQGNLVRAGKNANQPTYGINISNAGCTNNLVTNNDIVGYAVAFLTGGLNDAGAGTVVAAGNRVA